jgi:4-amino-4-deoxy-L-arabinose transferase-like glycosyltransferase
MQHPDNKEKHMNNNEDKHAGFHLLIFVMSLLTPFMLYLGRHLDDNRLTSWKWVFDHVSLSRQALFWGAALVIAWFTSWFSFYEKRKPLVLFAAAFILAAFFWSEPEVIVDASRYFTQAKFLKVYGAGYFTKNWGDSIFAWTDLPLVPFFYGLVFRFLGEHRILIQILNTVFFSLTAVLTYYLGRVLWDEDVGFWGGLLLLGFPYLYTQVPLFLVDVATMFFFMLTVVSCVYALEKGGAGRIILAGFAVFLLFYAKYSSWMMLTVIPLIFVYFLLKNPGRTIKRGGAAGFLAAVLIGGLFLYYKDIFAGQLDLLMQYQKPGLKSWSESYVSTFLFQAHPFIITAALFSFVAAARKADLKYILVSFLFVLFVVLQVKRIRYTLPIFPMIALMAAYGLAEIQNKGLIKHVVFSIIGISFAVAYGGYLPLLKSLGVQNLQAAGKYLNTAPAGNVRVISLAGQEAVVNPDVVIPMLDIYTSKNLRYEEAPKSAEVLERAMTSPLRFTWEYPTPEFYSLGTNEKDADGLVVISDSQNQILPEAIENIILQYPVRKIFQQSSHIFQHQTFVTVYHK